MFLQAVMSGGCATAEEVYERVAERTGLSVPELLRLTWDRR